MTRHIYFSTYQPAKRQPLQPLRKRRSRLRRATLLLLAVLLLSGGVWGSLAKEAEARERHKVENQQLVLKVKTQNLATLNNQLANLITANPNIDLSVSVIDNANGVLRHYGDESTFDSASVGKLITATDFLHQVEVGKETLQETINGNTAAYELQQMIVNSDDDAWVALNDELGYPQLQGYANSLGITDYDATADTLASNDIAHLLQKLYSGQVLNQADSQMLLGYMRGANYRNFIVAAVPNSDTVYHKIGLVNDNVHDAAIITNSDTSLELVIFTNGNGTYDWTDRAVLMQQITKDVLSAYFVAPL